MQVCESKPMLPRAGHTLCESLASSDAGPAQENADESGHYSEDERSRKRECEQYDSEGDDSGGNSHRDSFEGELFVSVARSGRAVPLRQQWGSTQTQFSVWHATSDRCSDLTHGNILNSSYACDVSQSARSSTTLCSSEFCAAYSPGTDGPVPYWKM